MLREENGSALNIAPESAEGEILFMNPIFKSMIWGGERLGTEWGYDIPDKTTGECWGVGAHPNGDCTVRDGRFEGITLGTLWKEQPQLFGNVGGDVFPLLIKIIDARSDLSIQVHPDDKYAAENENGSLGKTECWYILDAQAGAELVIGHNARNKEELFDMVNNKRWSDFLRYVPVKAGDFIQIEPGTVHAIKGGIELLETQQNSDITYRVYDYDRVANGKPRELHIQKSLDVITVPAKPVDESVIDTKYGKKNCLNELISCKYYRVWKLDIDSMASVEQKYSFMIMSVIEGDGLINGRHIKKGDHFILPSGFGTAKISGNLKIIASTVN